ncbi:type III secretion system protein PrgN, partial [Pseudomonas aeruginosa]|nr:type III secretion system protein PrgN [Pseudomonas aeruginosa]
MSLKNYVYSHPVNVFIIGRLGLSVEVFCELYDFKQGTLSSCVTREKTFASLPMEFLHALSLASGEATDQVYDFSC